MSMDPIVDHPALKWFRDRPREGFKLIATSPIGPDLSSGSRLGGFPFLPASEAWPVCATCGTPLFFVGQFGRDLPPLPLPEGADLLAVYKCGNSDCECWPGESRGREFFHLYNTAAIAAVQSPDAGWEGASPYRPPGIVFDGFQPANRSIFVEVGWTFALAIGERLIDFPGWEEYDGWREITDSACEQYLEYYPFAGAKLLGHPKWEQGPSYPQCRCGNRMQHLLQFEEPHVQLGDGGRLHIFHCADWCCGAESLAINWADG